MGDIPDKQTSLTYMPRPTRKALSVRIVLGTMVSAQLATVAAMNLMVATSVVAVARTALAARTRVLSPANVTESILGRPFSTGEQCGGYEVESWERKVLFGRLLLLLRSLKSFFVTNYCHSFADEALIHRYLGVVIVTIGMQRRKSRPISSIKQPLSSSVPLATCKGSCLVVH